MHHQDLKGRKGSKSIIPQIPLEKAFPPSNGSLTAARIIIREKVRLQKKKRAKNRRLLGYLIPLKCKGLKGEYLTTQAFTMRKF